LAGITPKGLVGKAAKTAAVTGLESAALGGLTAAEQVVSGEGVKLEDVATSMVIPPALKGVGAIGRRFRGARGVVPTQTTERPLLPAGEQQKQITGRVAAPVERQLPAGLPELQGQLPGPETRIRRLLMASTEERISKKAKEIRDDLVKRAAAGDKKAGLKLNSMLKGEGLPTIDRLMKDGSPAAQQQIAAGAYQEAKKTRGSFAFRKAAIKALGISPNRVEAMLLQQRYARPTVEEAPYRRLVPSSEVRGGKYQEPTPSQGRAEIKQTAPQTPTQQPSAGVNPESGLSEQTHGNLKTWMAGFRKYTMKEVKQKVHELRIRQHAAAQQARTRVLKDPKATPDDVRIAMKRAFAGAADIHDVPPPPLSPAEQQFLSRKADSTYPNRSFEQVEVGDALQRMFVGKYLTDRDFTMLKPVLGPDLTTSLFKAQKQSQPTSLLRKFLFGYQLTKSSVSGDIQVPRNLASMFPRHPVVAKRALVNALRGIKNPEFAKKLQADTEADPYYKDAKKYGMDFVGTDPWSSNRADWWKGSIPEWYAELGKKSSLPVRIATAPLRLRGRWFKRLEPAYAAPMNNAMLELYKLQVKKFGPDVTPEIKRNIAQGVSAFCKVLQSKTPEGQKVQEAVNYLAFSAAATKSRFYSLKVLFANKGYRAEAASLIVSNLTKMWLMSTIPHLVGEALRWKNPDKEPWIDGEINPLAPGWPWFKVGKQHIDLGFGDGQFYRFILRTAAGVGLAIYQKTTGKVKTTLLGVKVPSVGETILQYGKTRSHPAITFAEEMMTGKDVFGRRIKGWEPFWQIIPTQITQSAVESANLRKTFEDTYKELEGSGILDAVIAAGKTTGKTLTSPKTLGESALSTGAALMSAGVYTGPEPGYKTLTKFQDIISKKAHNKKWENLTPDEQTRLTSKYQKQFDTLKTQIKQERIEQPGSLAELNKEKLAAGKRVLGMLDASSKDKMAGFEDRLQMDRAMLKQGFRLNDKRYYRAQQLFAETLNRSLASVKNITKLDAKTKENMVDRLIKNAKAIAGIKLKAEIEGEK
jgi:hypothetical protein